MGAQNYNYIWVDVIWKAQQTYHPTKENKAQPKSGGMNWAIGRGGAPYRGEAQWLRWSCLSNTIVDMILLTRCFSRYGCSVVGYVL